MKFRGITPKQAKAMLDDAGNKAIRALALEVVKRIVLRTPVKTGRARGNWNVGVGSPDSAYTDNIDKGGWQTISRGHAIIGGSGEGQIIYITNSLPYILSLEHGWSEQAPAGMVSVTLAELQNLAVEIAARIRRLN